VTLNSIAVSGETIVFAQKYYNRVQVYDSEASFLYGFSLRGSSSAFDVAINNAGEIIDCTPRTGTDLPYDIYSDDGNRTRRAYDEDIVQLCREAQSNDVLSNGSVVSINRNPLGYRITVAPPDEREVLRSNFQIIPYIIGNLLYLPYAIGVSLLLFLAKVLFWLRSLEGEKNDDNFSAD